MSIEDLGIGSIVEAETGNLYRKTADGWVLLKEQHPAYLSNVKDWSFTVLHEVKKGPLDDFVKGDVISFSVGTGLTRIAVKCRDGFWEVNGVSIEYSSEELAELIFDTDSIRKVGRING